MISVRQRNALRGIRLVVYDSVADYVRRAEKSATETATPVQEVPGTT
jgi:hypothetical protein